MSKVEQLSDFGGSSQADSEEKKMVDKSVGTLAALLTFWVREARWVTFENGWLFGKLGVVFWVIVAFCPALSCSFLTRQIALGTVTKLHNPVVTTVII